MPPQKKEDLSFEKSFERLEKILEKLSNGAVTLDESLTLYEEADKLIANCGKRLNEAEQKIEMLIKKRDGELELNPSKEPSTENFN